MRIWRKLMKIGRACCWDVIAFARVSDTRRCTNRTRVLFRQLQRVHGLSDAQMTAIREDIRKVRHYEPGESGGHAASGYAGRGAGQAEAIGDRLCESQVRENLRGQVHGAVCMTPPRRSRKTRRPASISSSFPIFRLPTRWSG